MADRESKRNRRIFSVPPRTVNMAELTDRELNDHMDDYEQVST